jgi:hypothetical protein
VCQCPCCICQQLLLLLVVHASDTSSGCADRYRR